MRTNDYKLPLAVGALLILAVVMVAPAWAASVEPVPYSGSSIWTCEAVCGDDACCVELARFEANPKEGEVGIEDGASSNGVTLSNITYKDENEPLYFDWESNIGIVAVIVKDGPDGSNVYFYDPAATSDTYLTTPEGTPHRAISHISFCYVPTTVPEFPTLALPAALLVGMLGLVFAVRRKNE